jgi:hypothetical protein
MANLGTYEINESSYGKLVKAVSFVPLSLPETFPDYFVQTTKISKTVQGIWTKIAEKHCKDNKAKYYLDVDSAVVYLCYKDLPDAAAKLRVEAMQKQMVLAVKQKTEPAEAVEIAPPEEKKQQVNEDLQRVLKEGLRVNPNIEEVRIWSERALQNFAVGGEIPDDIKTLVQSYKFAYNPVFNAESSTMVGALIETNPKGISPSRTEDVMRDNIAQINAAHLEISRLLETGNRALVMASIDIRVMTEKHVEELIILSLRKMPQHVRNLLVVEVRGLRGTAVPPKLAALLTEIGSLCRSLVIDTGILSCPDFSTSSFKPFCYSFNFNEVRLPKEQMLSLMKKYVQTYKNLGAKTLMKNVPNKALLIYAEKLGFTFLSGPMVFAPKLQCPLPRKMTLQAEKETENA